MKMKKISYERAKAVSKAFLPVVKSSGPDEFLRSLYALSWNFPEIRDAYIESVIEYEKEKTASNLEKVRNNLKGGEVHGN